MPTDLVMTVVNNTRELQRLGKCDARGDSILSTQEQQQKLGLCCSMAALREGMLGGWTIAAWRTTLHSSLPLLSHVCVCVCVYAAGIGLDLDGTGMLQIESNSADGGGDAAGSGGKTIGSAAPSVLPSSCAFVVSGPHSLQASAFICAAI